MIWSYRDWGADWLLMIGGVLVLSGGFVALVFWLVRSSRGQRRREFMPARPTPSGAVDELLAEFFGGGEVDA